MKGDFSRIPFAPGDNITSVLLQQGRPLVEADLNEAMMAVLMNQRKIIRLLRNAGPEHHGPFKNAFLIRHTAEGKLQVDSGDYRFDDILLTNPTAQIAQSYLPIGDRFVVRFDGTGESAPKSKNFVVGLAAIERPMLIGQQAARSPGTGDLRAGLANYMQWAIIHEPYGGDNNTDTEADAIKKEIEGRNTFGDPPPYNLQVAKTQDLPREYGNRLWRLEIHSIKDAADQSVRLKLAIDNGSTVFGAKFDNAGSQIQRFAGKLPAKGEFVEVESEFDWLREHWLGDRGQLHKIETPAQYRDGILGTAIAKEVVGRTAQVRVWNWETTTTASKLAAGIAIGPLLIRLKERADSSPLRPRDGWSFRTDQIKDQGTIESAESVFGTRQPIYYAVLGTASYNDTGKVTTDRHSYRATLNITSGTHLAENRPARIPHSAADEPISHVAETIACRGAFPEVQNMAVKRWLASTTLGEIAGLSKEQLRQRIERDSQSKELDASSLERDLNLIVAKRGQFLAKDMLV